MNENPAPVVGEWYAHLDKGGLFQVVAVDDASRTVEMQQFDGDVEEVDFDEWYTMPLEPTAEPEDPAGALDLSDADDRVYNDSRVLAENLGESVSLD